MPEDLLGETDVEKWDLMGGMYYRDALAEIYNYPRYSAGFNYSPLIYRKDDESIPELRPHNIKRQEKSVPIRKLMIRSNG